MNKSFKDKINFPLFIIFSFPFILVTAIWLLPILEEYKTKELATLLFTILIFILAFFELKEIVYIRKKRILMLIVLIYYCFFSVSTIPATPNGITSFSLLFLPILFIILFLLFSFIDFFMKKIKEIILKFYKKCFMKKSKKKSFNITEFKINSKESIHWKNIIDTFTTEHKKVSLSLIKKNKLSEELNLSYNKATLSNLFKLKHYIGILHTFQEALLDIIDTKERELETLKKEGKRSHKEKILMKQAEEELLSKLIFKSKLTQYNMSFHLIYKLISSIINYFKNILFIIGFIFLLSLLLGYLLSQIPMVDNQLFIDLVEYKHLFLFVTGIFFLILTIPLSFFYFTLLKFNNLSLTHTKHDEWRIFFKNLSFYLFTFVFSIILMIGSIYLLAYSGLEYNQAFHFIVSLILPIIELQNLPAVITHLFGDDIVFGIFSIKIVFLILIFSIGVLFIRHIIELYIERYDSSQTSQYSIPPEFAKFFSYLILSIVALVLFYGTLFINYPNLSDEYDTCKSFLKKSYKINKRCQKLKEQNQTILSEDVKEYCNKLSFLGKDNLLSSSYCQVAMSFENNKSNVLSSQASLISPNRSLSDYLPLSIFLALFGTVIMLATKNLLENYFSGLSLKINAPYEEGERIRIDGGEMLAVEEIGFRATTFYGISSNAHLVVPHQQLTHSTITNYTQPTLDYRKKITIYIPDRRHDRSIPREAEKILLLSAFISTGVKKPRLNIKNSNLFKSIKEFKECILNCQNTIFDKSKNNNFYIEDKVNIKLRKCEENVQDYIKEIWKYLSDNSMNTKEAKKIRKKLFLNEIYKLLEKDKDSKNQKEIAIIKKIIISIMTVLNDYQIEANEKLMYSMDEYCVKRKFESLYNNYDYKYKKSQEELDKLAVYLVNISYYYFALAKQLWKLKVADTSDQKKNDFDNASLELLDVPRVTSAHKRDMEGAFWEVTLLVTVELGEQSDEIIHHINMYVDELWDIFNLPSRCKIENEDFEK